ncbi:SigB/SigF/SigG family RNA polymerase sigma factor [Streptomyces sp. So13.3]|uniref:SigB/SigF/SigG family RNA polymerase sigma factor n=1 Tax=Streptomyces TaxID=1883 RepID=UPI001106B1FA|nr:MULTISPECIES: SigB/SigF/SigG family RNA polymerase sigma factor [Streptomyces]MCZ4103566.1 SigB/SigF/SigG family RNA polymerase sigma factor [Streptomyces sp. H39-C1]QNA77537.1 SigB/SigF/SigG family RNA polymerase sigma factor [Streptomyces sp. So13.3]
MGARATTDRGARADGCCPSAVLPWIEDAAKVPPQQARQLSKAFLARLRQVPPGSAEYRYARDTLVVLNISLVRYVAGRYANRADLSEDIRQVGTVGLIKAIDRFDLERQVEFTTFAIPYISGEIKRYFRDTAWAVRVPRSLQERRIILLKAREALHTDLGRPPTTAEVAQHTGLSTAEVHQGVLATAGYTAESLDVPAAHDDTGTSRHTLAERIGATDPGLDLVETLLDLKPLLAALSNRERTLLHMRFAKNMTQTEIGAVLGCSQMHISRLLSRTLATLRTGLLSA